MSGLFAPGAPSLSDAVLVAELLIGGGLIVGAVLARLGHIRAHKWVQSVMILVNIPIALYAMVPSYTKYVLPGVPADLGMWFYLAPTLMLVGGLAAEALGVYILLVAGTDWLPERLRFRRYKLVMRVELGLWWTVLLTGILTYGVWYAGVNP
jgi:uncharacterized membrane protein YozB (DUF420 family)